MKTTEEKETKEEEEEEEVMVVPVVAAHTSQRSRSIVRTPKVLCTRQGQAFFSSTAGSAFLSWLTIFGRRGGGERERIENVGVWEIWGEERYTREVSGHGRTF